MGDIEWFRALAEDGRQYDILHIREHGRERPENAMLPHFRTLDGHAVEVVSQGMYRIIDSGEIVRRL